MRKIGAVRGVLLALFLASCFYPATVMAQAEFEGDRTLSPATLADLSSFFLPGAHDLEKGIRGQGEDDTIPPFYGLVASSWDPSAPPSPGVIYAIARLSPETVAADMHLPPGVSVYGFHKSYKFISEFWTLEGRRGLPQKLGLLWETNLSPKTARTWEYDTGGGVYAPGLIFVPKAIKAGSWFFNFLHEDQFTCGGGGRLVPSESFDDIRYVYHLSPVYKLGTPALLSAAAEDLKRNGMAPKNIPNSWVIPQQWIDQLLAMAGLSSGDVHLVVREDVWGNVSCRDWRKASTCTGDVHEYFWGVCLNYGTAKPFCSFQGWNWKDASGFGGVGRVVRLVREDRVRQPLLTRRICQ